jgi:hypothetical protein
MFLLFFIGVERERGSAHDFTSSSILTWHNSAGCGIVQGTIELLPPSF